MKAQLQTKLARNKEQNGKVPALGFIRVLPSDVNQVSPQVFAFCFPNGPAPTHPWPLEDILRVAQEIPLRKTRKEIACAANSLVPAAWLPSLPPAMVMAMMQYMAMQQGAALPPEVPPLTMLPQQPRAPAPLRSLLDRARSNSSDFEQPAPLALGDAPQAAPQLALADGPRTAPAPELPLPDVPRAAPPQLAVPDATNAGMESAVSNQDDLPMGQEREQALPAGQVGPPAKGPDTQVSPKAGHKRRLSLAESLDRMQQARALPKQKASKSEAKGDEKKTAKTGAVKPQAKKKVVKPKPVSKSTGKAKKPCGKQPLSKSDLKAKLLKTIPAKLKNERKEGCSKCRWVKFCTISCWKSRGWTI